MIDDSFRTLSPEIARAVGRISLAPLLFDRYRCRAARLRAEAMDAAWRAAGRRLAAAGRCALARRLGGWSAALYRSAGCIGTG